MIWSVFCGLSVFVVGWIGLCSFGGFLLFWWCFLFLRVLILWYGFVSSGLYGSLRRSVRRSMMRMWRGLLSVLSLEMFLRMVLCVLFVGCGLLLVCVMWIISVFVILKLIWMILIRFGFWVVVFFIVFWFLNYVFIKVF